MVKKKQQNKKTHHFAPTTIPKPHCQKEPMVTHLGHTSRLFSSEHKRGHANCFYNCGFQPITRLGQLSIRKQ